MSQRNNQPLPFFLTWYEVWYLSSDFPLSSGPNDVIYCILLSRVITEPDFNSYQAWKLKLMEVHTPSPLRTIYAQRTIGLDSDVLRDLVPFVQFKKREKHPWRSVTFSKVAG